MNICDSGLERGQSTRLLWLDALRVLACFGVVVLHVWAPVTYQFFSLPSLTWWAGNAAMVLIASWSVPMFVMISGALLLSSPNHEHVRQFFSGRARLFWQTAFWMFFFVTDRLLTA
jgi:surface polysaccharide O-acyltransferase-like enzyme